MDSKTLEEKRKKLLGWEWYELLKKEFHREYMKFISIYLYNRKKAGAQMCPENKELIFNAYRLCPATEVKIAIMGQDPYYTPGTMHGLAFSTKQEYTPKSLQNIFKEIYNDIKPQIPFKDFFPSNDLTCWAQQGVFLLNAVLTGEIGGSKAHKKIGWQNFTAKTIEILDKKKSPVVFMLWGNDARTLKKYITSSHHLILEAAHPSPLSAHKGFMGCRHFSMANKLIKEHYGVEIDFSTRP